MPDTSKSGRHSKGANLVELVKLLRVYRRTHPLEGLSPAAEEVLSERILPNKWYPLEILLELIDVVAKKLLGSSEQKIVEMGIYGGRASFQGYHRGYVKQGDPAATLMALRHIWRTYFDFGEHHAELDGNNAVIYTVHGYPDVSFAHGLLIIAWDLAAAQLSGATEATYEVLEAPWKGAAHLRYRITFRF